MPKFLSCALLLLYCFCGALSAQSTRPAATPGAPAAAATLAAPAPAAGTELSNQNAAPAKSFLENLIKQLGFLAYPFAALSVITIALIILFLVTVRQGAVASDQFMNSADALIRKQDFLGLLAICNRQNEMISRVTQKALEFATKNPTAGFEEVREVAAAEGSRQANQLLQRVSYLADISSVAPLLGLLGTVIGMMASFDDIASGAATGSQQNAVASGVGQALMATASGLAIAIPAIVFYAIFRARANGLVVELEAACTHIMAVLGAQYKRLTARPNPNRGPGHSGGPGEH